MLYLLKVGLYMCHSYVSLPEGLRYVHCLFCFSSFHPNLLHQPPVDQLRILPLMWMPLAVQTARTVGHNCILHPPHQVLAMLHRQHRGRESWRFWVDIFFWQSIATSPNLTRKMVVQLRGSLQTCRTWFSSKNQKNESESITWWKKILCCDSNSIFLPSRQRSHIPSQPALLSRWFSFSSL